MKDVFGWEYSMASEWHRVLRIKIVLVIVIAVEYKAIYLPRKIPTYDDTAFSIMTLAYIIILSDLFSYWYAKCCYAEFRYAECCYGECS